MTDHMGLYSILLTLGAAIGDVLESSDRAGLAQALRVVAGKIERSEIVSDAELDKLGDAAALIRTLRS